MSSSVALGSACAMYSAVKAPGEPGVLAELADIVKLDFDEQLGPPTLRVRVMHEETEVSAFVFELTQAVQEAARAGAGQEDVAGRAVKVSRQLELGS